MSDTSAPTPAVEPDRTFRILNRWSGEVQFTCELTPEVAAQSRGFRLGFAVKKAVSDGARLVGASLDRARLADTFVGHGVKINRVWLTVTGLDYPINIFDEHMKIGCEFHSIADWASFDNSRIAQMDGARSRRFWTEHRDALLALAASDKRGAARAARATHSADRAVSA